jgi:hypothetical protein
MSEQEQASMLARWLDQGSSDEAIDSEVMEAVLALRPDLAPAARVSIDDILDEVSSGPVATQTDHQAVAALVAWMEQRPGEPPPAETDPEVVEAVIALRPDLAPAHRVDLAQILHSVRSGPLAKGEEESSLVSLGAERKRRVPSRTATVGFGLLAAAAIVLIGIRVLDAPPESSEDRVEAREEVARESTTAKEEIKAEKANLAPPAPAPEAIMEGRDVAANKAKKDSVPQEEQAEEEAPARAQDSTLLGGSASAVGTAGASQGGGFSSGEPAESLDSAPLDDFAGLEVSTGAVMAPAAEQGLAEAADDYDFADGMEEASMPERESSRRASRAGSASADHSGPTRSEAIPSSLQVKLSKLTLPDSTGSDVAANVKARLEAYLLQVSTCANGVGIETTSDLRVLLTVNFQILGGAGTSVQSFLSGSLIPDSSQQLLLSCVETKVPGWNFGEIADLSTVEAVYEIHP